MNVKGNVTLEDLNDREAVILFPVVLYMAMLSLVGFLGNAHVFIVFIGGKYKRNSTFKVFVLFLASIDMTTCLTVMPFEIVVLTYPYMFYNVAVCKVFRNFNLFLCGASTFLLVVIAFERYRRVCRPLKVQLTIRRAKCLCSVALLMAVSVSWPMGLFQGAREVDIGSNFTGVECSISDEYQGSTYHSIFSGALFVVFVSVISAFIVLYCLIGRKIHLQRKKRFSLQNIFIQNQQAGRRTKALSDESTTSCESTTISSTHMWTKSKVKTLDEKNKNDSVSVKCDEIHNPNALGNQTPTPSNNADTITVISCRNQENSNTNKRKMCSDTRKVTRIMCVITLVFILSYLPYLILEAVDAAVSSAELRHGSYTATIYHIFLRGYYINNIVNPFIYCFHDVTFRNDLKSFYKRLCCH